ncbi:MAG: hypothetical protein Q7R85_04315 [bacterium]|nr:hypothetical protein [bacterium]
MRSYIGVRGLVSPGEGKRLVEIFREITNPPARCLAIVVDVSDDTFAETLKEAKARCGERNEHAHLNPSVANIPKIFVAHESVLNFVNFATTNRAKLVENLERVVGVAGPLLHGIQLAMDWPPTGALRAFRVAHPELRVILRVSRDGVRTVQREMELAIEKEQEEGEEDYEASSPEEIAAMEKGKEVMLADAVAGRVASYAGGITDVLLNLSGEVKEGGRHFDAELMTEFLRALRRKEETRTLGMGVAGGFGGRPFSIRPVEAILREFPNVSMNGCGAMVNVVYQLDVGIAMSFFRNAEDMCANV